jgi:hypothetical protein
MFPYAEQQFHPVIYPIADMYDGDPASDVVSLKHYAGVTFLLTEGAGGTGTCTLTVEECSSDAAAGASAIAYQYAVSDGKDWGAITTVAATGYTTIAGANKQVALYVPARSLADGFPFVRVQVTEVANSAVAAGINAILWGGRYGGLVAAIG